MFHSNDRNHVLSLTEKQKRRGTFHTLNQRMVRRIQQCLLPCILHFQVFCGVEHYPPWFVTQQKGRYTLMDGPTANYPHSFFISLPIIHLQFLLSCQWKNSLLCISPLKAKVVCTLRTAKRVSVITAVVFIAFDAQFFFIRELRNVDGSPKCKYVNEEYGFAVERIKSIIYTFGPFSTMTLLNLAIAFKFFMLTRKTGNDLESTSQALNKSATRGTVTLLLLSVTFIILTGPASLYSTVAKTPDPILKNIFLFLQFLNHSINAVLYCVVGSKLRTELIQMIKYCGKKENPSPTSRATSPFTIDLNTTL